MKDFDISKYLREHQLGSYGILNHYVDLKPLKEVETEEELATEVPYAGPDQKLTGMGDSDEFNQAEVVSEEDMEEEFRPDQPLDTSKFIGRLPKSVQTQSSVDKVMQALKSAGISRDDIKAFIMAVKTDSDALPLEESKLVLEFHDDLDYNRIMDLGGNRIEQGIISLMDDGFPAEDVLELCQMLVNDQYGAKAQGTPY